MALSASATSGPGWQQEAACLGSDPDLWFPPRGGVPQAPKDVCAGCPVQTECLEYALENNEEFGIWGGTSERQRRLLRRQRRLAGDELTTCGSDAGYYRHRTKDEQACLACKAAHAAAERHRSAR